MFKEYLKQNLKQVLFGILRQFIVIAVIIFAIFFLFENETPIDMLSEVFILGVIVLVVCYNLWQLFSGFFHLRKLNNWIENEPYLYFLKIGFNKIWSNKGKLFELGFYELEYNNYVIQPLNESIFNLICPKKQLSNIELYLQQSDIKYRIYPEQNKFNILVDDNMEDLANYLIKLKK
jgi:hypothetical protein